MTEHEMKLINESIQAHKNMVEFHKARIFELEIKKNTAHEAEECPQCFKFKIHKKNT